MVTAGLQKSEKSLLMATAAETNKCTNTPQDESIRDYLFEATCREGGGGGLPAQNKGEMIILYD